MNVHSSCQLVFLGMTEVEYMSCMKHSIVIERSSARSLPMTIDIQNLQRWQCRTFKETP